MNVGIDLAPLLKGAGQNFTHTHTEEGAPWQHRHGGTAEMDGGAEHPTAAPTADGHQQLI